MLRVADHFERSDTGRQRSSNEDRAFARPPLFVVADGMGGARAGEVASGIVVEVFEEGLPDQGSDEERLSERIAEANRRIHELAQADVDRAGMGTTVTAASVDASAIAVAHVGDSRAYRLRSDELERLTEDHSLVAELVRRGKLTEEEAEDHPQRSVITRALGPEGVVEVETRTYPARANDVYLLCSDGLTSMIGEGRIGELLRATPGLADVGDALIEAANEAGGRDNITVVLFRLEEVGDGAAGAEQPTSVGRVAAPTEAAPVTAPVAPTEAEARAAPTEPGTQGPRRTAPLPPRPAADPEGKPRRRRRRIPGLRAALAILLVATVVLGGAWIASRGVYFVGTDDRGVVAMYRGLPYDGPGGFELYERVYTSGVPATALPARRRDGLLDHRLRSRDDAEDLVRKLELGQVE